MPSDKQPSKTAELRRSNKPIMEKRRRARINNCLNELKNLLLEAMRKDPARHSKLEKADILEMTVKHLQNLQRQQMALTVAADPGVVTKYRAGFNECAEEVSRYVGTLDGIDSPIKQRLLNHLANCMSGLGLMTTSGSQQTCNQQPQRSSAGPNPALQLIPSRLPNGEIALLLPNQAMSSWPLNNNQRFVSVYANKNNNGAPPTTPVKAEQGPRPTLLTVNVGYNNRGSCPSPNFAEDMSVSSPTHSTESYRRRCDSRGSLSPAMSDYSDSNSRQPDFPCSNDRSNPGVQFEPDMNWPKSMATERMVPASLHPARPNFVGSCPTFSNEGLVNYGGPVVKCPTGSGQNEPEVLVPVNLSKDADKMWRPW